MSEQIFFEKGRIKVTSARAIFENQTYALSGITSVRGEKVLGPFAILLGVICFVLLIVMLAMGGKAYFVVPLIIAGIILFIVKVLAKHVVMFSSASGEQKAFVSRDKQDDSRDYER